MVWTLFRDERVVAPCHHADCSSVALFNRDFVYHRLRRRSLIFAAERHEHGSRADCRVEPFGKSTLGAAVQILRDFFNPRLEGGFLCLFLIILRLRCYNIDMFFCPIGIQKCSGEVNDGLAVP